MIFATVRGKRPHQFRQKRKEDKEFPPYDKACAPSAGDEGMLPKVLSAQP